MNRINKKKIPGLMEMMSYWRKKRKKKKDKHIMSGGDNCYGENRKLEAVIGGAADFGEGGRHLSKGQEEQEHM